MARLYEETSERPPRPTRERVPSQRQQPGRCPALQHAPSIPSRWLSRCTPPPGIPCSPSVGTGMVPLSRFPVLTHGGSFFRFLLKPGCTDPVRPSTTNSARQPHRHSARPLGRYHFRATRRPLPLRKATSHPENGWPEPQRMRPHCRVRCGWIHLFPPSPPNALAAVSRYFLLPRELFKRSGGNRALDQLGVPQARV